MYVTVVKSRDITNGGGDTFELAEAQNLPGVSKRTRKMCTNHFLPPVGF